MRHPHGTGCRRNPMATNGRGAGSCTVCVPWLSPPQPRRPACTGCARVGLPRVPANPRTLTYPHSHHTASSFPRQRKSGHVPTNAVGAQHVAPVPPPRGGTTGGPNGRPSRPASAGAAATTHQVHPAIQVPPGPRSCSHGGEGLFGTAPLPLNIAAVPLHSGGDHRGANPTPPRHMVERGPGGEAHRPPVTGRSA